MASRSSSRARKKVNYNEDALADSVETKAEHVKMEKARSVVKKGPVAGVVVFEKRQAIPKKNKDGFLVFSDHKEFRPNLTPKEVLQRGSFGGTYFRSIHSSATGEDYNGLEVISEFPADWFEGLNLQTQVVSKVYDPSVNTYKIRCGGGLDMWEGSGWIAPQDPYGWFMWYCRFYLGRRSSDDDRQISRANGVMSSKGRFRNQLINKLSASRSPYNNFTISPVIRQALQHWAYELTEEQCQAYCRSKGIATLPAAGAPSGPPPCKGKMFDPDDMKPLNELKVKKLRAEVAKQKSSFGPVFDTNKSNKTSGKKAETTKQTKKSSIKAKASHKSKSPKEETKKAKGQKGAKRKLVSAKQKGSKKKKA